MVSNQQVMPNFSRSLIAASVTFALLLSSGCQLFPGKREQATVAAAPAPASAPEQVPAPDNAIEVAIANAAEPAATEDSAPPPVVNQAAPLSYTVKRGDTLWDISAMYLRDPWLWPEIWHVNPNVQNPHLIYPGDVLTLAYDANGRPQVMVTQGSALRVSPLVRSQPLEGPIATIPFEAIAAFLGKPSIVSKEDLQNAPRVAALRDGHVVAGAGQDVYVKGLQNMGPGRYSMVKVGEPLKDPESGKVLGFMGTYTGAARADSVDKITRAAITDSTRETTTGDLLFAVDTQSASRDIVPRAPPSGVSGQIMAVVDGVSMIGQYQVVAVNRGTRDGLETGHVLAIDQKGEVISDRTCKRSTLSWCIGKKLKLPDERAGTLLVFKTFDRMSYGLIVNTTLPVRVADRVRTP
jgi:LysM repeat protein